MGLGVYVSIKQPGNGTGACLRTVHSKSPESEEGDMDQRNVGGKRGREQPPKRHSLVTTKQGEWVWGGCGLYLFWQNDMKALQEFNSPQTLWASSAVSGSYVA